MHQCQMEATNKLQWKLHDKHLVNYQQVISHLNDQCVKAVRFTEENPSNGPAENDDLQTYLKNIDYLMEQMQAHLSFKSPESVKSSHTQSTTQTTESFESQSEIEYLSDLDDEEDVEEEVGYVTPLKPEKPSVANDDKSGGVGAYSIPFPKEICRFVLWQLLNSLMAHTQQSKNEANKNEKCMLQSRIASVNDESNDIDYDNLNLISGTLEPHKRENPRTITADWKQFADSFESAYCDLFKLDSHVVWVLVAKLTMDVCLDHIEFDQDGLSILESLMSIPSESAPLTLSVSSPNIIMNEAGGQIGEDDDASSVASKEGGTATKSRKSTKYHLNKKWGKIKRQMSTSSGSETSNSESRRKKKRKSV